MDFALQSILLHRAYNDDIFTRYMNDFTCHAHAVNNNYAAESFVYCIGQVMKVF